MSKWGGGGKKLGWPSWKCSKGGMPEENINRNMQKNDLFIWVDILTNFLSEIEY